MSKLVKGLACASLLVAPAAMAGVTANVGAASEYMFRGVPQSNGAAIQGGLDYSADSGLYVGTWASNVGFAGAERGNELDLYAGFTQSLGGVTIDVGSIGYIYSEAEEAGGSNSSNFDFIEGYVGFALGPVSVKGYYSPDFNNNSNSAVYATGTATFPVSSTISLFAQGGHTAWENTDSYVDASAGVTATAKEGLTVTLAAVGTHGRSFTAFTPSPSPIDSDDVKFVISGKKTFSL